MKRKVDLTNAAQNKVYVGSILKAFRETNELSQRDVALNLGYANINFISMIETGRSSPPIGKIGEIVRAVQADTALITVVLKYLYPDAWNSLIGAIHDCPDIFGGSFFDDIDARVEAKFIELIGGYSAA